MQLTDIGILGACLAHGISPADLPLLKGASDAAADDPRSAAVGQTIARAVRDLFVVSGKQASVAAQLYARLAATPVWEQAHWDLLTPALRVLDLHRTETATKQAGAGPLSAMTQGGKALLGRLAGALPGGANLLAWLALAGGTGIGTAAWAARRGSNDDEDAVALEDKIRYYNSVASEIENELGRDYPQTRRRSP